MEAPHLRRRLTVWLHTHVIRERDGERERGSKEQDKGVEREEERERGGWSQLHNVCMQKKRNKKKLKRRTLTYPWFCKVA